MESKKIVIVENQQDIEMVKGCFQGNDNIKIYTIEDAKKKNLVDDSFEIGSNLFRYLNVKETKKYNSPKIKVKSVSNEDGKSFDELQKEIKNGVEDLGGEIDFHKSISTTIWENVKAGKEAYIEHNKNSEYLTLYPHPLLIASISKAMGKYIAIDRLMALMQFYSYESYVRISNKNEIKGISFSIHEFIDNILLKEMDLYDVLTKRDNNVFKKISNRIENGLGFKLDEKQVIMFLHCFSDKIGEELKRKMKEAGLEVPNIYRSDDGKFTIDY